jgi:hypothetical protein
MQGMDFSLLLCASLKGFCNFVIEVDEGFVWLREDPDLEVDFVQSSFAIHFPLSVRMQQNMISIHTSSIQ